LRGAGTVDVDGNSDTIQFQQDSIQDLKDGAGPRPAYATTAASDVDFAAIPLVGVPSLRSAVVFALTNPGISTPGLDLGTPGDTSFSATISYSAIADVVGDLDLEIPEILVPPDAISVTGTLRVLAGGGSELRNVSGTFAFQTLTTLLAEDVTVDVTAVLTLNLLLEPPPPVPVPAMPAWMLGLAGAGLLAAAAMARRQRS
jgi:hypothetical protein